MSFLSGLEGDIDNAANDVENVGSQVVNTVANAGSQAVSTVENVGGQALGDVESAAKNPTVDEVAGDVATVAADAAPILG